MEERILWHETRSLHHACEAHDMGASMAEGTPPAIWYAAWIKALHQIHSVLDAHSPNSLIRAERLLEDLKTSGYEIPELEAASEYANSLKTQNDFDGAVYVLAGAHLMGGEVMRKRLIGYPTKHLEWDDRKTSIQDLQKFRTRGDIVEEAAACFYALLKVMDEITETYRLGEEDETIYKAN